MKLIVDLGNTKTKLAIFHDDLLLHLHEVDRLNLSALEHLFDEYPGIRSAVLSSVAPYPLEIDAYLEHKTHYIKLSHQTALPFKLLYATPLTLGMDRIAAVAGAMSIFPEKTILVIDAGTSITYDLITFDKRYLGGAISPGIHMRYKALHTFTGSLPLVEQLNDEPINLIGDSTISCINSGVLNGVMAEMNGIIEQYVALFDGLKVMVSGGDYKYFEKHIKNDIFATPNIVIQGLKKILDFNESI